jgi:PTS system cellobiose-specific IIB component
MKDIMLVCSAGMSTSLLVTKMEQAAEAKGFACKIWADSESEAKNKWEEADILLLGPQVRFLEGRMKEMVKNSIPVLVIDMIAYGTMNGEKVLDTAIDALK